MLRNSIIISVIAFCTFQHVLAQVTFIVTEIPENTPSDASIYIVGDFNGWDPSDDNFILTNNGNSNLEIEIPRGEGSFEYKFTRGSWETVEGDATGGFISNRSFSYGNGETVEVQISGWEDMGDGAGSENSTAAENVIILDEAFSIPQLNRTRRIWMYLPPDYDSSEDNYPVLYMHDGQNVFDAVTSFVGEWEIDETLNDLFDQGKTVPIVVAIDNGGAHRINEYSPWVNSQYGGGEGDEYLDFVVNTLKPFIDNNFRTKPDRDNTAMAGSSMGGLISFYAGIKYPEVFSKLGVFSPSFPIFREAFESVRNLDLDQDYKIYIKSGALESDIANDSREMYEMLIQMGLPENQVKLDIPADGQHSEWFWAREFKDVYSWMFADDNESVVSSLDSDLLTIKIFPNPAKDNFTISPEHQDLPVKIALYDALGNRVGSHIIIGDTVISTKGLSAGLYFIKVGQSNNSMHTKLVIDQ